MANIFAQDFYGIPASLQANEEIRSAVVRLAETEAMPGKVTEGAGRLERFRDILKDLVEGRLTLEAAYERTERDLPRQSSAHGANNRVFAADWAERLVRTQVSRLYNQAVMERLLALDVTECFVPHSSAEDANSVCSRMLAGHRHEIRPLYERLVRSYRDGNWSQEFKIPHHPHCTHVVTPVE